VERAYFCYPIRPGIVQATAQFAQAAKEASVEFIVNMSQKSAREDAKSDAARQHWLAERVFDWSGVPTAYIRPTYFAEWLLYLAPMIRQGQMMAPFGTTGRHAPVAAEDQASVIVGILEDPAPHKGKIYPLFGAVELTHPEIAATIGRVLKKDVKYQQVSIEEFGGAVRRPSEPARREPSGSQQIQRAGHGHRPCRELVSHGASARGCDRPSQRHLCRHQRRHLKDWRPSANDARGVCRKAPRGLCLGGCAAFGRPTAHQ
jgi:hypothetical protein